MCTIAMIIWAIFHPPGERVLSIPSSAMAPTLILGDRVVMVPYDRGDSPRRGDIVAFRDPADPSVLQVFRVIGLPGDTVQMVTGEVVLNGAPLPREALGAYGIDVGYEVRPAEVWRETLSEGGRYDTADTDPEGFLDNTPSYTVPSGHFFVLGDNRDNAADSRLPDRIGFVPAAAVLGRMDHILATCKDDGRFLADRTGLGLEPGG